MFSSLCSAISSILDFRTRPKMPTVDPTKILLDPSRSFDTDSFLLTYTTWASQPSVETDFKCRQENILNEFDVELIMHNKVPSGTEHEFLIIDTKDQQGVHRIFLLERTLGESRVEPAAPESTNLAEKLMNAATSAYALSKDPSTSPLRAMEEGSSSQRLSSKDHITLSATQIANIISDSVDKGPHINAKDRFLGGKHLTLPRWGCSQNVQFFRPNRLSLFEFAVLANVVHEMHPDYTYLGTQCYFYAELVYAAAKDHFGVRHSEENLDDAHLRSKFGRYKGAKVNVVTRDEIDKTVVMYKKALADEQAQVFFYL